MSDLKELKLDLEYLLGSPDGVFGDREVIYGELAETALKAITTLEAKLAVAREALENLIDAADAMAWAANCSMADDQIEIARQALKEIEQ